MKKLLLLIALFLPVVTLAQQANWGDPENEVPTSDLGLHAWERASSLAGACEHWLSFGEPQWRDDRDSQRLWLLTLGSTDAAIEDAYIHLLIQQAFYVNDDVSDRIWDMLGCASDEHDHCRLHTQLAWDFIDDGNFVSALAECDIADMRLSRRWDDESVATTAWVDCEMKIYEIEMLIQQWEWMHGG